MAHFYTSTLDLYVVAHMAVFIHNDLVIWFYVACIPPAQHAEIYDTISISVFYFNLILAVFIFQILM